MVSPEEVGTMSIETTSTAGKLFADRFVACVTCPKGQAEAIPINDANSLAGAT